MLISLEFQPSTTLLVLCWCFLYSTSRWEHSGSPAVARRSNREKKFNFLLCATFSVIISQPSSTLFISSYAKTVHSLHVRRTCSFSLCSIVEKRILYLSPQALAEMEITVSNNVVWKDLFIAVMIAASKSTFIVLGGQKDHQLFNRVNK